MNQSVAAGDVNEAFAVERAAQLRAANDERAAFEARLASGKLVPVGGDQYRVNDPGSWDDGEIWILQAPGLIVPQHSLDESKGFAALYSAVPAWHKLGNVIPGGISDIDEVMRLGGIDFEVRRSPVLFRPNGFDGPTTVLADHFVNYRTDTGEGLGTVGARYEVVQNRQVFEFLQDLVDSYSVTWESAGALRGGRKVFICLRMPHTIRIDAEGVNDEIVPFIVAVNSHDGSSQWQVVATPWRPVCGNTERFAVRDAFTRWGTRHTRNATERIEQARYTLRMSVKYYDVFAAEEEQLARAQMTVDQFRKVINDLWEPPSQNAPGRARTNHRSREEKLVGYWVRNSNTLGRTAYAAERAITEFLDWGKNVRPGKTLRADLARAALTLEGADDDMKTKAHRRLLTLVRG